MPLYSPLWVLLTVLSAVCISSGSPDLSAFMLSHTSQLSSVLFQIDLFTGYGEPVSAHPLQNQTESPDYITNFAIDSRNGLLYAPVTFINSTFPDQNISFSLACYDSHTGQLVGSYTLPWINGAYFQYVPAWNLVYDEDTRSIYISTQVEITSGELLYQIPAIPSPAPSRSSDWNRLPS